mgnify:CR=1 FL=1
MKLGFIGTGNMASAIMGGIIKNNVIPAEEIIGADLFAPGRERAQKEYGINVTADNKEVASKENVIEVQNYLSSVRISDDVLKYIVLLCEKTREMPLVELGVSPRGVLALVQMAKAHAVLEDRIYVIPEDVQYVFLDVCAHRMILRPQARVEGLDARDILNEILKEVKPPLAD